MTAWPSTLPQSPLIEGASGGFAKTKISTQMDAGAAKVRRRFTAATKPFRCRFEMTLAQLAILETFHDVTCSGGVLRFDFPHPVYGTVAVRFVDEPQWEPPDDPTAVRVSINLEVMP